MKLLFVLSLLLFQFASANAQGFKITLEAPQYHDGIAYLIYYYG